MSTTRYPIAWIVDVDEIETRCPTRAELGSHLLSLQRTPDGRFLLLQDFGTTLRWPAFLGLRKRDECPCLSIEWSSGVAALIFLDDAWSEYRAIDVERPVQPSEDVRKRISHGEFLPYPIGECMSVERAFAAIAHYVAEGERPPWLTYRYVK